MAAPYQPRRREPLQAEETQVRGDREGQDPGARHGVIVVVVGGGSGSFREGASSAVPGRFPVPSAHDKGGVSSYFWCSG